MSYEGYIQYLCPKGHLWELNVYELDEIIVCPYCDREPVFHHSVDETNGVELDDEGVPISNTVPYKFEEIGWEDLWYTDHYDNNYAVKIPLYKIPKINANIGQ